MRQVGRLAFEGEDDAVSELVTGDAVVLGLQPARLPSRALAILIDLAVLWTTYVLLTVSLMTAVSGLDEAAGAAVAAALLLLVLIGIPVAVETLTAGRSLGKLVCGLRVVREDGGPVRFRHALVRGGIGFVETQMTLGVVACTASLVSARGRRLGDVFAGTLVVRERTGSSRTTGAVVASRHGTAGRLRPLDLSAVPDPLWLAVRQYLMRAAQLDPQVSRSMATRLAGDVAAHTGVAVPSDMSALTYLAGLVAERRARDSGRTLGGVGYARAVRPRAGAAQRGRDARASKSGDVGDSGDAGQARGSGAAGSTTGFVPPA